MIKYSELFLTQRDLSILQDLSNGRVKEYHPAEVSKLQSFDFVAAYPLADNEFQFIISQAGLDYLEYNKRVNRREREARFDKYFTRAIAIAALIISVIALLKP